MAVQNHGKILCPNYYTWCIRIIVVYTYVFVVVVIDYHAVVLQNAIIGNNEIEIAFEVRVGGSREELR